ncbi:hypothetical protein MTR_7g092940 [Medicago truncatula]|uniref:Uncharacterized protein n=1 Tax=Medicago truncatula TaxID=3880 RepID=G7KVB3_MEDTR|nr:hypothetical protein MTR_7g092940 [Medicago truncatula]
MIATIPLISNGVKDNLKKKKTTFDVGTKKYFYGLPNTANFFYNTVNIWGRGPKFLHATIPGKITRVYSFFPNLPKRVSSLLIPFKHHPFLLTTFAFVINLEPLKRSKNQKRRPVITNLSKPLSNPHHTPSSNHHHNNSNQHINFPAIKTVTIPKPTQTSHNRSNNFPNPSIETDTQKHHRIPASNEQRRTSTETAITEPIRKAKSKSKGSISLTFRSRLVYSLFEICEFRIE